LSIKTLAYLLAGQLKSDKWQLVPAIFLATKCDFIQVFCDFKVDSGDFLDFLDSISSLFFKTSSIELRNFSIVMNAKKD
jgi:uncharacterized protein with ParB-like and HNH nuclease domain